MEYYYHSNIKRINYLRMKKIFINTFEYILNSHNLEVCMLRTIAEVGCYMVKVVDEDFICWSNSKVQWLQFTRRQTFWLHKGWSSTNNLKLKKFLKIKHGPSKYISFDNSMKKPILPHTHTLSYAHIYKLRIFSLP